MGYNLMRPLHRSGLGVRWCVLRGVWWQEWGCRRAWDHCAPVDGSKRLTMARVGRGQWQAHVLLGRGGMVGMGHKPLTQGGFWNKERLLE